MKPFLFGFILFLSSHFLQSQGLIDGYEYWMDEDSGGRISVNVAGGSPFLLDAYIPTIQLSNGLHTFHIRFREGNSGWSSVYSQFFVVLSPTDSSWENPAEIVNWQYWFDEASGGPVTLPVSGSTIIHPDTLLATSGLSPGLHVFHFRSKDSRGKWSTVYTQFFVIQQNGEISQGAPAAITRMVYWFDENSSDTTTTNTGSLQVLNLNQLISTANLAPGIHAFHACFLDENGKWSSVLTQFFVSELPDSVLPEETDSITGYRYWFNMDTAAMQIVNLIVPQSAFFLLESIDCLPLDTGMHVINYQFKSHANRWSSVFSHEFHNSGTAYTPVVLNASVQDVSCFGLSDGSIALNPTGGAPPYAFTWAVGNTTTSLAGLGPGTFGVTITDSALEELAAAFPVSQPADLEVSVVYDSIACNGDSTLVQFVVSGGTPPYSGAGPQMEGAGTIPFYIFDQNNCPYLDTLVLSEPAFLDVSVTPVQVSCAGCNDGGGTAGISGGSPPYSYLWSNGATGSSVTDLPAGTHFLTLTDANFCQVITSFELTDPGGIPSEIPLGSFFLYPSQPNPFSDLTMLSFYLSRPAETELIICNAQGKKLERICKGKYPSGRHTFKFYSKTYSPGAYFIWLIVDGVSATRLVVIEK